MAIKRGLGKGLGALFPENNVAKKNANFNSNNSIANNNNNNNINNNLNKEKVSSETIEIAEDEKVTIGAYNNVIRCVMCQRYC